ncbi:MAG: kynureninase, partial [Terriglobales bacterium]
VAVMNSLTVNLHLMLATFYRPTRERHQILIERPAFPSDRYAAVSHLGWHGYDRGEALIQVGPRPGEAALRPEDLLEAIGRAGERLALVLLGGVNYYTGQVFDLAACARAAHAVGAMAGFDLAHAIGNVPVALNAGGAGEAANGADFAVWCGYKYLCGGPGAPGGCFVAARHGAAAEPLARLAGWWGNRADTRFEMREAFEPAAGAAGWQVSSPSLLSLAGLRAGLDAYDAAPAAARLRKSQAMVAGFGRWADALVPGLRSITPASSNGAAPNARGAQWSLDLGAAAMRTQQQLRVSGIYSDVRGPILRLSFHPLYNRYADVIATLDAFHRCQG